MQQISGQISASVGRQQCPFHVMNGSMNEQMNEWMNELIQDSGSVWLFHAALMTAYNSFSCYYADSPFSLSNFHFLMPNKLSLSQKKKKKKSSWISLKRQ